jgi:hypothetical protein
MKWKNIKKAGLTTERIAKSLRYANANSFRNSSKYECVMNLLDEVAGMVRVEKITGISDIEPEDIDRRLRKLYRKN